MCRVLNLCPGTHPGRQRRPPSTRASRDAVLIGHTAQIDPWNATWRPRCAVTQSRSHAGKRVVDASTSIIFALSAPVVQSHLRGQLQKQMHVQDLRSHLTLPSAENAENTDQCSKCRWVRRCAGEYGKCRWAHLVHDLQSLRPSQASSAGSESDVIINMFSFHWKAANDGGAERCCGAPGPGSPRKPGSNDRYSLKDLNEHIWSSVRCPFHLIVAQLELSRPQPLAATPLTFQRTRPAPVVLMSTEKGLEGMSTSAERGLRTRSAATGVGGSGAEREPSGRSEVAGWASAIDGERHESSRIRNRLPSGKRSFAGVGCV